MGCSSSEREYEPTSGNNNKKSPIHNSTLHLEELEKEEKTKPKVSRRKEIIKIRAEINKIETKKKTQ